MQLVGHARYFDNLRPPGGYRLFVFGGGFLGNLLGKQILLRVFADFLAHLLHHPRFHFGLFQVFCTAQSPGAVQFVDGGAGNRFAAERNLRAGALLLVFDGGYSLAFALHFCLGGRLDRHHRIGCSAFALFDFYVAHALPDAALVLRGFDDFFKTIVRHDGQRVHFGFARALAAVGQPQSATDGLLHQLERIGCPQRHDGVEVGHVPALGQHGDVNDNFDGVFGTVQGDKLRFHLFAVFSVAVNAEDFIGEVAVEEVVALRVRPDFLGVLDVFADHQYKRLDLGHPVVATVNLQRLAGVAVGTDGIFEHDVVDEFVGHRAVAHKVFALRNGGYLDVFAVGEGVGERVFVHHAFEGFALFVEGRGGHFQSQHGLQLVQGGAACVCAVAVGFVHEDDEVLSGAEVVPVALPEVFAEAFDARRLAFVGFLARGFAVAIKLADVENIDAHLLVFEDVALRVVVAGDDDGRVVHKLCNAPKHVLLVTRIAEVFHQLVVNGEVGREDKKITDAPRQVQVGDAGTHEASFAHARGDAEGQRHEIALEIAAGRVVFPDRLQLGGEVGGFV